RLDLALEAAQRVLKRLAFLHSNLCQGLHTSKSVPMGRLQNSALLWQETGIPVQFCRFGQGAKPERTTEFAEKSTFSGSSTVSSRHAPNGQCTQRRPGTSDPGYPT